MADFESSTQTIPEPADIPRHVAVIMDGNGRWAKRRFLPRVAGHRKGIDSVRAVTRRCGELGVQYLTLFAFSSENWRRPKDEVSFLMQLFVAMLEQEVSRLHSNGVRLKVIGSRERFDGRLTSLIDQAEALTRDNSKLTLTVAANYGGRWDLLQAVNRMAAAAPSGAASFSEHDLAAQLSMNYAPEPDLFIRTGGEQRVSNFLLWQLAYTELYFTDMLWPDFDAAALDQAVLWYQQRERRFGRTSEQLAAASIKQKA